MRRASLGVAGERAATRFLATAGLAFVAHDVRLPGGQIDLVVEDGGRTVLVEVKARSTRRFGSPEEAVGPAKVLRLRRLAAAYAREFSLLLPPRVDVVAVDLGREGEPIAIRHLRDVLT